MTSQQEQHGSVLTELAMSGKMASPVLFSLAKNTPTQWCTGGTAIIAALKVGYAATLNSITVRLLQKGVQKLNNSASQKII